MRFFAQPVRVTDLAGVTGAAVRRNHVFLMAGRFGQQSVSTRYARHVKS
jgi:hypothetical protein